jgi:3-methylfumaryl-CoA hydratase
LLFRYSALTFNGHRIHYDEPYARSVEGYPGLVVHGPLTATVLQQFAAARKPHRWLASFEFRGQQPLFVGETMTLQAVEEGCDSLVLQALGDDGRIAMRATASFDPAASA